MMTEQQLKSLKQYLDKSAKPSCAKLDNAILDAAQKQADQVIEELQGKPENNWLSEFFISRFTQSAFITSALAIFTFCGVALMMQQNQSINNEFESYAIDFEYQQQTKPLQDSELVAGYKTDLDLPQTQKGRNLILAQTPLPNVDALLDEMGFNDQQHELYAKSLINIAISDIRFMLDNNNFDKARVRYAQLKDRCENCPLPDTLEALLITTYHNSG